MIEKDDDFEVLNRKYLQLESDIISKLDNKVVKSMWFSSFKCWIKSTFGKRCCVNSKKIECDLFQKNNSIHEKYRVIALTGSYGSGKTYFIEKYLKVSKKLRKGRVKYYSTLNNNSEAGLESLIKGKRKNTTKTRIYIRKNLWTITSIIFAFLSTTAILIVDIFIKLNINLSYLYYLFLAFAPFVIIAIIALTHKSRKKLIIIDDLDRVEFDVIQKIFFWVHEEKRNTYLLMFDHENLYTRYIESSGVKENNVLLDIEKYIDWEYRINNVINQTDLLNKMKSEGYDNRVIDFYKEYMRISTNKNLNLRNIIKVNKKFNYMLDEATLLKLDIDTLIFSIVLEVEHPNLYSLISNNLSSFVEIVYGGSAYSFAANTRDPSFNEIINAFEHNQQSEFFKAKTYSNTKIKIIEKIYSEKASSLFRTFIGEYNWVNDPFYEKDENVITIQTNGYNKLFFDFYAMKSKTELLVKIKNLKDKSKLLSYLQENDNYVSQFSASALFANNVPLGEILINSNKNYYMISKSISNSIPSINFNLDNIKTLDDYIKIAYPLKSIIESVIEKSKPTINKIDDLWDYVDSFDKNKLPEFWSKNSVVDETLFKLIEMVKKFKDDAFNQYNKSNTEDIINLLREKEAGYNVSFLEIIQAKNEYVISDDIIKVAKIALYTEGQASRKNAYDDEKIPYKGIFKNYIWRVFKKEEAVIEFYAEMIKDNINLLSSETYYVTVIDTEKINDFIKETKSKLG